MPPPASIPDKNIFLRRMRRARYRQSATAISSLVAACLLIAATEPVQIGAIAYYAIVSLLLLNAVLAMTQYRRIVRPITELLYRLQEIDGELIAGNLPEIGRLTASGEEAFAYLASSINTVLDRLFSRIRNDEMRLKQSDDILTSLPDALVLVTRDGKVFHLVKDQSDTPLPEGLVSGQKPSAKIWGDKTLVAFHRAVEAALDTGQTQWIDFHITPPGHSDLRHFRASLKKTDANVVLMSMCDMTDIDRRFRNEMAATEGRERAHRRNAIRHFAATIAHDGKNIFAAIQNLVELNRNSNDSAVRDLIPIAEDAIRRGVALMQELSVCSGEARFHFQTLAAKDFFDGVAANKTLKALLPPNVELISTISSEPMPYIDVDPDQAWKVPFNLFKNAVEAMGGAGGRIWVDVKPFEMTESTARDFQHTGSLRLGPGVLVTRSDDGPGISRRILPHLFDPYFSSKGTGRGLGLATVMAVVAGHEGAIRVISEEGRGTAFLVWLPASRNSPEELEMIRKIAPNGEVLLVDDDQTILKTTALLLKTLKIAAHPASNETDAIHKVRALHTRLRAVIIDAHLGGFTSENLVRRVHAEKPDIPIILASGDSETSLQSIFANAPYNHFLEKPFSLNELKRILDVIDIPVSASQK